MGESLKTTQPPSCGTMQQFSVLYRCALKSFRISRKGIHVGQTPKETKITCKAIIACCSEILFPMTWETRRGRDPKAKGNLRSSQPSQVFTLRVQLDELPEDSLLP